MVKKKILLSIGIIVDPIGVGVGTEYWTSPEEEVKEIKRHLTNHFGNSYKLNFYDSGLQDLIVKQLDIFVVDYGGLLPGATELLGSVMRTIREYSEQHPSCILILWSKTTRERYDECLEEGVIGDSIEEGANILVYCLPLEKFWKDLKVFFPEEGEK